jgi:hypothetical protein
MNYILTLFSFLIYLCSFGQKSSFTPVDRSKVQKTIEEPQAFTYYPKLLARFNAFDSTLTKEEFRFLYYGYVF